MGRNKGLNQPSMSTGTQQVRPPKRIDARTFSLDTSVAVNEAPAAEAAVDTNTNACDDETRDQYIGPEQDRDSIWKGAWVGLDRTRWNHVGLCEVISLDMGG